MTVKTILVVEDEALVAMELVESLSALGYRVPEVVADGDRVQETFLRVKPDLVLMDIRIGGSLDGIEAARQLRRISSVPLVFLTAYNDPQTLMRAGAVHPDGFLIKPFGGQELAAVVSSLLARRQVRQLSQN